MNKKELIRASTNYVTNGEKLEDKIYYLSHSVITNNCGGHWMALIDDKPLEYEDVIPYSREEALNDSKYIDIKNDIIENGWRESEPCVIIFTDVVERDEDGEIGDIIVFEGNRRLAFMELDGLGHIDIPVRFKYEKCHFVKKENGREIYCPCSTNKDECIGRNRNRTWIDWPYRNNYEIQKG